MKRFIVFITSLILLFNFSANESFASSDFETSFTISQTVAENGVSHIVQEISLKNKLSRVYATQYSLSLESNSLDGVKAYDSDGSLETKIAKQEEVTTITIIFNKKTVGAGKQTNFNLEYNTAGLVEHNGQIWEVFVPKLSNADQIENYSLSLQVPNTFGKLSYISPEPSSKTNSQSYQVFNFDKQKLSQNGASLAFGELQIFDFVLDYHLQNTSNKEVIQEIALPPDTSYQQVYYTSILPKPKEIVVDQDGNWLARFNLSAGEKTNIETIGKAKIFPKPQDNFPAFNSSFLADNLTAQNYWQINDSLIKEKANSLSSVKDIYSFVVNYLNYDFERVKEGTKRLGASEAIRNPNSAICTEFTDLFIAIARAKGIPAREINGYAYTTNPRLMPLGTFVDVLHAWPEYWDEQTNQWIPIDPTWGNTTNGVDYFNQTDLNHFVFAIHGKNSQYPPPAGSYKINSSGGKDIQVKFGDFNFPEQNQLEVEFNLDKTLFTKIKKSGEIIIKNNGARAIYSPEIAISAKNVELELKSSKPEVVLPLSEVKIPIEIYNSNIFFNGTGEIDVVAQDQTHKWEIKVSSSLLKFIIPLSIGLLLFLGLIFFIFKLTLKKISDKKSI